MIRFLFVYLLRDRSGHVVEEEGEKLLLIHVDMPVDHTHQLVPFHPLLQGRKSNGAMDGVKLQRQDLAYVDCDAGDVAIKEIYFALDPNGISGRLGGAAFH